MPRPAPATRRTPAAGRSRGAGRRLDRIALGLAVSSLTLPPGRSRTIDELAAFCACSRNTIIAIQATALAKLRRHCRRLGISPGHLSD
jgi:hypothetical protein